MKAYDIFDADIGRSVGTLLYYGGTKTFIIELCDGLDEWTAPMLFTGYVKSGILTIPRTAALMWVRERIIPPTRQNISSILTHNRLREYDEIKLLDIAEGRCAQDEISIKRIDDLPNYVTDRAGHNLTECAALDGHRLLCFFEDDSIKMIKLTDLSEYEVRLSFSRSDIDKVLINEALYRSCRVGSGGYYATFNDSIDIPASLLYTLGTSISLTRRDFITFMTDNVLDTTDACDVLECSRQNISYLINQDKLTPIKKDIKGNLYLRGDVEKNRW